jgi:hypothetical protein
MAGKWKIVCEPEGKTTYMNPDGDDDEGRNEGAMKVLLVNGSFREEVSRVGFVRRNSKHPDVDYADQLTAEVEKARASVVVLNEQFEFSGETL